MKNALAICAASSACSTRPEGQDRSLRVNRRPRGLSMSHVAIDNARFRVTFEGPEATVSDRSESSNPIRALGRALTASPTSRCPGRHARRSASALRQAHFHRRHRGRGRHGGRGHRSGDTPRCGARKTVPAGGRPMPSRRRCPMEQLCTHGDDRHRRHAPCQAVAGFGADRTAGFPFRGPGTCRCLL